MGPGLAYPHGAGDGKSLVVLGVIEFFSGLQNFVFLSLA